MTIYDELVARGLIAQVTDEDEIFEQDAGFSEENVSDDDDDDDDEDIDLDEDFEEEVL